jgi:hypothetical protein
MIISIDLRRFDRRMVNEKKHRMITKEEILSVELFTKDLQDPEILVDSEENQNLFLEDLQEVYLSNNLGTCNPVHPSILSDSLLSFISFAFISF